jgi:DNA-binding YbaB/EbfC family protein
MMNATPSAAEWKDMQNNLQVIKQKIDQMQAAGEAGAGLVKVIANGHKQILTIRIDPSLLQLEEQHTLQHLVVAATNAALGAIEGKIRLILKDEAIEALGSLPIDFPL